MPIRLEFLIQLRFCLQPMFFCFAFRATFALPDQVTAHADFVFRRIGLSFVGHGILPPIVRTRVIRHSGLENDSLIHV